MNLFRKMAKIVGRRGLARGYYTNNDGQVCALGALYMAEKGVELDLSMRIGAFFDDYPLDEIGERLGLPSVFGCGSHYAIAFWSDGSSQDAVVAHLLEVAEREEAAALEALDFEVKVPERELVPA